MRSGSGSYGSVSGKDDEDKESSAPLVSSITGGHKRWSMHASSPLVGDRKALGQAPTSLSLPLGSPQQLARHSSVTGPPSEPSDAEAQKKRLKARDAASAKSRDRSSSSRGIFIYYIIYALVNVIISVPGLYGYAAVIFNHPIFQDQMNALSKLVIFSSLMHQLGFCLFSSLPFAIGTVQDAGLIFLSSMSTKIANSILDEGGTQDEVISTTMVLLSFGTACLGIMLYLMGHFRLADAVSYLPMPVVGGYLAFIGYFCLEAGVGLCVSESMIGMRDWKYLADPELLLLALPGLAVGVLLTYVSRKVENPAALPLTMVGIPALFYIIIFSTGIGIDGAREGGWVGPVAPPVPFSDLFKLVDFKLVHWGLITKILPTWIGMVFVVSFASCLDVAAIAMDMGEALDTNKELSTVGICNFMSGMTFGFTGSYIFSQTIFTYRTGVHSRWVGVLIMVVFMYVVVSKVNILQVAPLFFLGSTLIFIGYDLLYEWLIEIRHKIFLTEYAIVWATFISIQFIGIDAGIIFGVLVSVVEHVVLTARTLSVIRVPKRSRAVYSPDDYKLLQRHGYSQNPKIVTLEIVGPVFFASSLQLLEFISEEIGLNMMEDMSEDEDLLATPMRAGYLMTKGSPRRLSLRENAANKVSLFHRPPQFVVLDLTQVPNLDASAARGCFLQLAKMCAKRGIVVCAAGASPKIDWMLRSHEAAYELEEEKRILARLQSRSTPGRREDADDPCEKILLFLTVHEALEFCENILIHKLKKTTLANRKTPSFIKLDELDRPVANSIADVFSHILGLGEEEKRVVATLEDSGQRYHDEIDLKAGQVVFAKDMTPDGFYVVLRGAVAIAQESIRSAAPIISGAGPVGKKEGRRGSSALLDDTAVDVGSVKGFYPVGGVFGYTDFLLDRPCTFRTVASVDGTRVAKINRSQMAQMRAEEPALDAIVQRILLHASILDLANCTCDE